MKVSSAMTREVICITPEDTLEDAYAIMTEWNIRHLPVVKEGRLVGLVSNRDVLAHMYQRDGATRAAALPVSDVMTTKLITCREDSTVGYVAGLMLDHQIGSVLVTDGLGHLRGLITTTDMLELLRERDDGGEHKVIPFQFSVREERRKVG